MYNYRLCELVTLSKFDMKSISRFEPVHCSRSECRRVICGSMFASEEGKKKRVICEDCYWTHSYGDPSFVKVYRHCILREVLTPEITAKLCPCWKPAAPYPLDRTGHRTGKWGTGKNAVCGLIKASDAAAIAKYDGMQGSTVESKEGLKKFMAKFESQASNGASNGGTNGLSSEAEGAATDQNLPLFLREHVEENPFGHMHMALRVGPLIIENGAPE